MVTNYGWIDCEFNGFGGDLISMAIVTRDNGHFYEVLNLKNDVKYEEWVEQKAEKYDVLV